MYIHKMAANAGELVFRIGQSDGNDSEIWDDTALIKAYDQAISSFKCQEEKTATQTNGEDHSGQNNAGTSRTPQNNKGKKAKQRKKKRKVMKNKNKDNKWRVGDHCLAIFTEDEVIYEAVIKSINFKTGTCWITYVGYGNEEEKMISDLMTLVDVTSQEEDSYISENGYDSMDMDFGPPPSNQSPHYRHSSQPYQSFNQHHISPGRPDWFYPPPPPLHQPYPQPYHLPPPFGMRNTPPPPPMPAVPPYSRIPSSLPPPPSPPSGEGPMNDQEALHAMLMSWYMSGYHTGYYQGMKNSRSQSKQTIDR